MTDYTELSAAMSIDITAPVQHQETVCRRGQGHSDGGLMTIRESHDRTFTYSRRVEGIEAVAELLFELLSESHDYTLAKVAGGDELRAFEEETGHNVRYGDGTIHVQFSGAFDYAVFLAARRMAEETTRTNMVRDGYSVENVLVAWIRREGFGYPDADDLLSFSSDDLSRAAHRALFTFCVDQTPGGEITLDAIPDETYEPRRGKDLYE